MADIILSFITIHVIKIEKQGIMAAGTKHLYPAYISLLHIAYSRIITNYGHALSLYFTLHPPEFSAHTKRKASSYTYTRR
jgi:hypothetical protein